MRTRRRDSAPYGIRFVVVFCCFALLAESVSGTVIPLSGGWEAVVTDQPTVSFIYEAGSAAVLNVATSTEFTDGLHPGQIVFRQTGADADTAPRIWFLTQYFSNLTGASWTGLRLSVNGGGLAWINVGETADHLMGPFPDQWLVDQYGFNDMDRATDLVLGGAIVPNGESFQLGIAGRASSPFVVDVDLSGATPVTFSLSQTPVIPEPAVVTSLVTVGLMLVVDRSQPKRR